MRTVVKTLGIVALTCLTTTALSADGWKTYRAGEYGFEMLVPEGTEFEEKEWSGDWGGVYAEYEGVKLFGIGKKKVHTAKEISDFAVERTGIAAKYWKKIDSAKKTAGWDWYETYLARSGNDIVVGSMGIGNGNSYLLFLKTTVSDYEEHKSDYMKWYKSVKLFKPE